MESKTYRIGDAARMLNLKTHVLRFWETEFPQLAPVRTEKGQRLYTEEHIQLLRNIRHMLHERGLTIDGARKELAHLTPKSDTALLHDIVAELEAIRGILRNVTHKEPDGGA